MKDDKLTVILPCAGKGMRLHLPYPKEMMRISLSHALIDYSFDFFKKEPDSVHFVIIIGPHKMSLVEYLFKYADSFLMSFIYQKKSLPDITGAIKSARYLFTNTNLVLLPDTIIELRDETVSLIRSVKQAVKKTGFSFLYKYENSKLRLRQQGSLLVKNNQIFDYEDKPTENLERFNAFWAGFAFREDVFDSCIEIIEKTTVRKGFKRKNFEESPIYRSEGVEVAGFVDMGTWDSVRLKLIKDYLVDHGIHEEILSQSKNG